MKAMDPFDELRTPLDQLRIALELAKLLPTNTTPSRITPEIQRFCGTVSSSAPRYVSVDAPTDAKFGECHLNVARYVDQQGGDALRGWAIWEIPGMLLQAEFHSIWISPTGAEVDVTPHEDGEDRILFLPDPQRGLEDVIAGVPVANRYGVLADSPAVRAMISAAKVQHALRTSLGLEVTSEERELLRKTLRARGRSSSVRALIASWKARRVRAVRASMQESAKSRVLKGGR